jgi:hypothetical protein
MNFWRRAVPFLNDSIKKPANICLFPKKSSQTSGDATRKFKKNFRTKNTVREPDEDFLKTLCNRPVAELVSEFEKLDEIEAYADDSISGLTNKERKKIFKRKRKIKRYARKRISETIFTKKRLLRIPVPETDERFIRGLPLIPDNKGSYYVGRHTIRRSSQQSEVRMPSAIALHFFNEFQVFFKNKINFNLNYKKICTGAYDTNIHVLQQTMKECDENPIHLDDFNIHSINDWKEPLKRALSIIKPPTFDPPEIEDILSCMFNPTANSGIQYGEFSRGGKKKDVADIIAFVAKKQMHIIDRKSDRGEYITSDDIIQNWYDVGARNKKNDVVPSDTEKKFFSRVVHMPSAHAEVIVALLVDPITIWFKEKARGPLYIGNSITRWNRFYRDLCKGDSAIEGDYSRHDSTIRVFFLTLAVCVLRTFYPPGIRMDNYFLFFLHTIVVKDYVVDGGFIFRITQGLPSGSKATSLLGSIVNLLVQIKVLSELGIKNVIFAIGGDDFVAIIKGNIDKVRGIEFSSEYIRRLYSYGFIIKPDELKITDCFPENIMDCPSFYKYCIHKGHPAIRPDHICERFLIPWEKEYNSAKDILKFLNSLIPCLGVPGSHLIPFYYYYSFVAGLYAKQPMSVESFRNCVKRHISHYDEHGAKSKYDFYGPQKERIPLWNMINRNPKMRERFYDVDKKKKKKIL